MQPPPRTGPPGASGPPPPSGPNMFRRTRPHKHPAAAATAAMQLATQPMMDPFAFARAPPPIGHLNVPNSSAPPMQSPPNLMYSQSGAGLLPEPQTQEDISAIPPGPPPSSLPGVTLFNPHSMAPPAAFSAPSPSYALPNTEHGYFNSREQPLPMVTEPPTMFTHSAHSQAPFSQEFQGQRPPLSASFQPMPQTTSLSQRAADHGSRPPSVQNYFQPTSDPPPQTFNMPPQTQIYPTHTSPHFNSPTSPVEPAHLQNPAPPPNPVHAPGFEWPDPGRAQQPSSHFQTQNYFSQSGAPPESWVSHPSQVSDYHQMGTSMSHAQPGSFHPQQTSTAEHGASSVPVPALYSQDSGTLSMFFKDNDVENEETLAGERNKALNGVPGSFQHPSNLPAHGGNADVSAGYRRGFPHDNSYIPYMNDGNPLAQENTQKPPDSQPDIVENLECVPNLEVLPSEVPCNPVTTAPHAEDQFETGPNIETPDSVPRPMRSASVSSNYSNMSHGSSTGTRRHQGVVGTFIQQESPRLTDDANRSAATGGYFEQIDTSPAGDAAVQPSTPEHIWQPTPSPPKPTGIFQASANSSFEPVRSQGVGVRPAEVDKAKMVAERATGCVSGNLEQPPDNLENLYSSSHPLPASAGGGAANMTPQAVHSLSRPSSRAFGASRPCDSPATTLWAQTDPTSFGTNILLAPAAPAVLAPLREPTADVIQPPEDGPLDLQPQRLQPNSQHLENLENPPKVSESEATDSQGNVGYASLLVSGSLHQHVLIAPPVSNYGVIPTSTPAPAANQSSPRETLTTTPIRLLVQGPSANNTSQALPVVSNQNPLYVSGPESVSVLASNQNPLNLTRDNTTVPCPEIATQPQPANTCPPLSRAQSVNPESHSAFQVNSQESTVPPPLSNHNPPSNYGLLDFSMHQSQAQGQPSGHPSSLHESPQSSNGFYLQVTKDAQQGARAEGDAPPPASTHLSGQQVPPLPSQAPANTQHAPNEPPKISAFCAFTTNRKEGYEDQWRYYPSYDSSFDDDSRRRVEAYGDDFDRRSIHSEQSAHSVHSSHSQHSRRSSFSSRSQQVRGSHCVFLEEVYLSLHSLAPPRPATPEKFTMPHCCARFGPGGHLVQVLPNLPSAGQPALVDIHNLEIMQQDTPDQVELRSFPGPLVKEETHKVDVIKFSQRKALECSRDNNLLDKSSACLLWEFIVLLCKQNGTAVGTDIAELLLSEHRSVWLPGKSPNETNLIDFNNEPLSRAEEEPGAGPLSLLSDTFMIVPENIGKETEHFRELLLFGRKKDALEAAMKGGLWGHALLLACKMDNRTHASVMTRFANSLPINDPLQTVYQLMSGRMPASATCCGEEKWGDWRPHLAMVLSNLTHARDLDTRTVTTMGDTLASKGLTDAAHFCYLMAQVGLGVFTKKSAKMVLIGSNHSLPFKHFASNEAIQRTEAYEYAQSLGSHPCSLPNFQVFKFIYACRLAESGLSAQAFQYCEVIARTVLMQPSSFSPSFISQIIQMSEKLRFFDPQLKEKPEQELFTEPEWLMHLRQLEGQIRVRKKCFLAKRKGYLVPQARCVCQGWGQLHFSVTIFNYPSPTSAFQDGMSPPQLLPPNKGPQFYPVPPSGPPGQIPGSAYPLQDPGFAHPPFQPQPEQPEMYPGAHLQQGLPPQMGQTSPHTLSQVPHSPGTHHPPQMPHLMPSSPVHHPPIDQSPHPPPAEMQNALPMSHSPRKNSGGTGWLRWLTWKGKNEAHLPDDKNKSIVWDVKKQKWVDTNEPEKESKPPPPPPSGFPTMGSMPGPAGGGPAAPPSSGPPVNRFSRKAGPRSRYVDILNPSRTAQPGGLAPAPADLFAPLAPMAMPTNLFVPSSGTYIFLLYVHNGGLISGAFPPNNPEYIFKCIEQTGNK
uniref:Protein transport protein sec16 n=1 Tax=Gouania willdenowi TaxID=441366 RepID=A0A8C5H2J0_GOUWI